MPLNSISQPRTPASGHQQAPIEATTGTHNDRQVSKTAGQNADSSSNFSMNIPRTSIRRRSARTPTNRQRIGIFRTLQLCFRGDRRDRQNLDRQQPSRPSSPNITSGFVKPPNFATLLFGAAQSGIKVAMKTSREGLASENSREEVVTFLTSADKGIRRATTAIKNISKELTFAELSDEEKQKLPAEALGTLEQQATKITNMAKTICDSTFLDSKDNFSQSGTTQDNGYVKMMEAHPEKDQEMRQWLRDGLDLGSELIAKQGQILFEGKVQSEAELSELQSRVNAFSGQQRESVIGDFTDEVMKEVDEMLKDKGLNQA